jgi:hypothetical protein
MLAAGRPSTASPAPYLAVSQMNGAVERREGAWRYEFYETCDLMSGFDQLDQLDHL